MKETKFCNYEELLKNIEVQEKKNSMIVLAKKRIILPTADIQVESELPTLQSLCPKNDIERYTTVSGNVLTM